MTIGKLYIADGYNNPSTNERMLELSLAKDFIQANNDIIEVGCVTPYYPEYIVPAERHVVIDPFDSHPKAIKMKARDYNYTYSNVLSISTVEHFNNGEYEPVNVVRAYDTILDMILSSTSYMITWPVGFNIDLDKWADEIKVAPMHKFKRIESQRWVRVDSLVGIKYNEPYNCGNGLYVFSDSIKLCDEYV